MYLFFLETIKPRSTHLVLLSLVSGELNFIKYYCLLILNSTDATSLHNNYEFCIVLLDIRKVRIFTSCRQFSCTDITTINQTTIDIKQIKMYKTIKISLSIIAALSFAACNNNNTKEADKGQKDTVIVNSVSADTTQNATSASGEIALDLLPANIKEFVTKNYAGYTMQNAAHDPLCAGGDAIDVAISKKGSANYSLIFLPNGTFVQQEEDINISKAPAKILDIVKTKYAGFTPAQQIERLTLVDKSIQYLLDITKDKTTKEVIFNDAGTVVCEH